MSVRIFTGLRANLSLASKFSPLVIPNPTSLYRLYATAKNNNPPPNKSTKQTNLPPKLTLDALRPHFSDFDSDPPEQRQVQQQIAPSKQQSEDDAPFFQIDARRTKIQEEAEREEMVKLKSSFTRFSTVFTLALISGWLYLGLSKDENDDTPVTLMNVNQKAFAKISKSYKQFFAPIEEKVLPDAITGPYGRPFTLCVELSDTLAHLEWDKNVGWRIATRSGMKQFLAYLSKFYEIVIFTNSPGYIAQSLVEVIDPLSFSMYRLYREHTRFKDGKYIKDVSYLNRNPAKVIMLDVKPENVELQPENAIIMKPFKGEKDDKELLKIITVLEELGFLMMYINADDVRPFLAMLHERDPNDPYLAWQKFKQEKRELLNQHSKSNQSLLSSLKSRLSAGNQMPSNLIDMIEYMAKEERSVFEAEQAEGSKLSIDAIFKERAKLNQKLMETMKGKKLKLFEMMMGSGQEQMQQEIQQLAMQQQKEMSEGRA
ncbi:mitochondrial inner membrane protein required for protein import [Nowakowskiella sp. JEL0407]|nr:mitochondrial inner membrane protein required for protein import [Nowakowskiella sp. JEL0407]